MKSKIISLSAISSALIAIFLSLGSYVQVADVFCLLIASMFIFLPLSHKNYKASLLTYLVGGVVAILFSLPTFAFSFIIPAYFVFFGLFPIVYNFLREKNINRFLAYFMGLLWCVAAFYGLYFYYTVVLGMNINDLPEFVSNAILYFIPLYALIFYVVYERFVLVGKKLVARYLCRYVNK